MHTKILDYIQKIPEGYSQGVYMYRKYGIIKSIFNNGGSFKIYGEELGGTNFVSLNYYITKRKELIKPCEMTTQKVKHFLKNVVINKV